MVHSGGTTPQQLALHLSIINFVTLFLLFKHHLHFYKGALLVELLLGGRFECCHLHFVTNVSKILTLVFFSQLVWYGLVCDDGQV